jgi:hypothetical protein
MVDRQLSSTVDFFLQLSLAAAAMDIHHDDDTSRRRATRMPPLPSAEDRIAILLDMREVKRIDDRSKEAV